MFIFSKIESLTKQIPVVKGDEDNKMYLCVCNEIEFPS